MRKCDELGVINAEYNELYNVLCNRHTQLGSNVG